LDDQNNKIYTVLLNLRKTYLEKKVDNDNDNKFIICSKFDFGPVQEYINNPIAKAGAYLTKDAPRLLTVNGRFLQLLRPCSKVKKKAIKIFVSNLCPSYITNDFNNPVDLEKRVTAKTKYICFINTILKYYVEKTKIPEETKKTEETEETEEIEEIKEMKNKVMSAIESAIDVLDDSSYSYKTKELSNEVLIKIKEEIGGFDEGDLTDDELEEEEGGETLTGLENGSENRSESNV